MPLVQKFCPICGCQLTEDDIKEMFRGCQDEYTYCPNCDKEYLTKVRYGEVFQTKEIIKK